LGIPFFLLIRDGLENTSQEPYPQSLSFLEDTFEYPSEHLKIRNSKKLFVTASVPANQENE
jgi:hypothetical protein